MLMPHDSAAISLSRTASMARPWREWIRVYISRQVIATQRNVPINVVTFGIFFKLLAPYVKSKPRTESIFVMITRIISPNPSVIIAR